MIPNDIKDGWKRLRSLSDLEWCGEMNYFFKSLDNPLRHISYSYRFDRYPELRKDLERLYESELSTWFCDVERIPA